MQTHAMLNTFNLRVTLGPFLTTLKISLKLLTSQCLGYGPVDYAVKGTDIECTTTQHILLTALGSEKLGML